MDNGAPEKFSEGVVYGKYFPRSIILQCPFRKPSDGGGSIFHTVVAPDPSPDHSRLWGFPIRSWTQVNGTLARNNGLGEGSDDRDKTTFIFVK